MDTVPSDGKVYDSSPAELRHTTGPSHRVASRSEVVGTTARVDAVTE